MRTQLLFALCLFLACACRGRHTASNTDKPSPPESAQPTTSGYEPLAADLASLAAPIDFTVRDESRARDIPVRVYLPTTKEKAPVVLFSHGLGGSREGYSYLGQHWSARGYVVVAMQHEGSDDSVWRDAPVGQKMLAMKRAASLENLLLRVQDVPAVLDQLAAWDKDASHALYQRLDLERVAMSGHSFGAVTTQTVSGQSNPFGGQRALEPRIKASIILSPSSPKVGSLSTAFGSVKIPWMLMTGTQDISPIGDTDVESRLSVYPHLPDDIYKYELVLYNAEHSAFAGSGLIGEKLQRNPNHHKAILALSTAFLDAHLRGDKAALQWLQNDGESVLEKDDRWQHKAP